jgi:hypothetical protein
MNVKDCVGDEKPISVPIRDFFFLKKQKHQTKMERGKGLK